MSDSRGIKLEIVQHQIPEEVTCDSSASDSSRDKLGTVQRQIPAVANLR